jgi:RNA polymerase primary sigma factor
MAKNEAQDVDMAEAGDAPLLDLNDASVKKLIARAKKRGIITVDELNEALPSDQMSPDQIVDVMSALNEMGVQVVESEEKSDDDEDEDKEEASTEDEVDPLDDGGPRPAAAVKKEPTDRTDDPVRMYLREMGAVELLSRDRGRRRRRRRDQREGRWPLDQGRGRSRGRARGEIRGR